MVIREANRQDLFSIAKVQVDSNRSTYIGIMPERYLEGLTYESKVNEWDKRLFDNKRTEFMFVAETDNKNIVGFASASLDETNDIYERELYSIYILKEFQRIGIGKLLIKAIVERYIEEGVRSLILWTLQDNPSRFFYEHLGGSIVDKRIINRGGKELQQIAYAWEDITSMFKVKLR
ncbi:MAG: GNAT family N-acetyltransferase [Bacillota bacterium]|nr:GNAT family N-acetyltransferase [Bacillota bacterium]